MRIALVIWSLMAGGAQRSLVEIASYLAARGHAVTLITMKNVETDFFAVPPGVKRVALTEDHVSAESKLRPWRAIRIFLNLRSALHRSRFDVVLSFADITNIIVLVASLGLRTPVVVAERTSPLSHKIGWVWRALRRITYPLCQVLVVQTSSVAAWARRYLPDERIVTIPNAVPRFALSRASCQRVRQPVVLGVGRLVHSKGFDLLLRAFARSGLGAAGWRLEIIGEGPERVALRKLGRDLGLEEFLDLPGESPDPSMSMSSCEVFALSSRYEGFPNVLLEAMACGAAPVAFDCASGPGEVIQHGVNGLLVRAGDVDALSNALSDLANDTARRRRMASNARQVAVDFAPEAILDRWAILLESHA